MNGRIDVPFKEYRRRGPADPSILVFATRMLEMGTSMRAAKCRAAMCRIRSWSTAFHQKLGNGRNRRICRRPEFSFEEKHPFAHIQSGKETMHCTSLITLSIATIVLVCNVSPARAQSDADRKVDGGGISVPGWTGMLDKAAPGLENARLTMDEEALHVTTGPQVSYWNPENTASGNYTVTATFTEPEYMNLNNHPHPYGLFIGGNEMGTENATFLYCAAYGNGSFIVRGFGSEPFQMNGRRAEAHEAVNKAAGPGKSVTQEIAMSVHGDNVECAINGTVVASYDKSDVVGEGKLTSTDGHYGIRFGHNTEGLVRGLTVTEN